MWRLWPACFGNVLVIQPKSCVVLESQHLSPALWLLLIQAPLLPLSISVIHCIDKIVWLLTHFCQCT